MRYRVPNHIRRVRAAHFGKARDDDTLQLMSTARKFARADRRGNPIHCEFAGKLMYESQEIARSTGQALARLAGKAHFLYPCPRGSHWHLTTEAENRGTANEQA